MSVGQLVYPLLPRAVASRRYAEINNHEISDWEASGLGPSVSHELQRWSKFGGMRASELQIQGLRMAVLESLQLTDRIGKPLSLSERNSFDSQLGLALFTELKLNTALAGVVDLWSFLSLIVFPDLIWTRFPNPSSERALGTPRNVLRRVWNRERVFGSLLRSGTKPLGEDELVGLLERSRLSRNNELMRTLAVAILDINDIGDRSYFVRTLMKQIAMQTGPRVIEALSKEELETLVGRSVLSARRIHERSKVSTGIEIRDHLAY